MNAIQPHDPADAADTARTEGEVSGAARIEAILAAGAAAAPAFLVVAGASAHASGWGARAAVEFATRAAERDRPVILIDLDLREPALHELVGEYNDEGISDVTLFGVSLHRAARTLDGHPFRFVPAGPFIPNPSEVLRNPRWTLILAEAAGMDALVIAYIPADASGVQEIAKKLRHAVVLARPDERGTLPRGCTVLGVIDPPADAAPAVAIAEPVEAAPSFVDAAPMVAESDVEAVEDDEEAIDDTLFIDDEEPLDLTPPEDTAGDAIEDDAILIDEDEPIEEDDEPVALDGVDAALLADGALALEALPAPLPRTENALPLVPDGAPPRDTVTGVVYSVPRLPAWQEQMIRTVAVLTLGYGTYYIIWRWMATLNPDALWFSIPLVLAETWGLLTAFVMVISVWKLQHRDTLPPPPDMSVDVFITTYDEPLEVIRRTAVGARAIRYPHNTYLLDDGKRDEVQAVAEELGIGYLRRPDNAHAKAGNLNYALQHTTGEFVLQLDADHVPLPHILHRLLGFFEHDPKLAFVQAPQDFYNTDGFTYDVNEEWQRIWEEQRLFFSVIQPGKDRLNCAFFCGSCAVFRREALETVGGFATQTVTEDIETSLLLHARGWHSLFYGESLAYGLAAGSATAFHVQHLRWGQGAMQVLRKVNPLTRPGLTLAQRISYIGSLTAYVGGVQKLVFYSAPIVFFLTGALPIRAIDREFLIRFVPFLLLSFILSDMMARGTANTWASERYQMAKFWTYTRAVASIFRRKPGRFTVTPKGPGHVPFRTYAPHVTLMVLSATAVVWATFAHRLGWVDYGTPGWSSAAFRANFMWAGL
ncbi:MAG TPA: glycosyltransferase, partial [Longimicrobium sp.]